MRPVVQEALLDQPAFLNPPLATTNETMAQTLLQFLTTQAPPTIPTQNTRAGSNTASARYSWRDIRRVTVWRGFNFNHIQQTYGAILAGVTITP